MAKKKRVSGKHSTPRKSVFLPAPWIEVADDLARAKQQPTAWWVIEMIRQAAIAAGRPEAELPVTPWDKSKE